MALLICAGVVISSADVQASTRGGQVTSVLLWAGAVWAGVYAANGDDNQDNGSCAVPFKRDNNFPFLVFKDGKKDRVIWASVPAAATAAAVLWITSYYTPSHRYECAIQERKTLNQNVLFKYQVTRENIEQIMKVAGAAASALPLVSIFLVLVDMDRKLTELISELDIALKDTGDYSTLGIQIASFLDQLHEDRLRIRESEHVVKNVNPDAWSKQWEIHNGNMMKDKEIEAMKELANRPQMHYGFNYHNR